MTKRYTVLTYDYELQEYTPQVGLTLPWQDVDMAQLLAVMDELGDMAYDPGLCCEGGDVHANSQDIIIHEEGVS